MSPPLNDASALPERAKYISAAGWFILLLSAGSALLPLYGNTHSSAIIGTLLVLAGAAEMIAGRLRHRARYLSMLAGALTILAGILFATESSTRFLSTVSIVAGWLFGRSFVLFLASRIERGSVGLWTSIAAMTDAVLALILVVGLSIATLVVSLFGATPPLVASFAWVLAVSFVATAMFLLEIAASVREREGG